MTRLPRLTNSEEFNYWVNIAELLAKVFRKMCIKTPLAHIPTQKNIFFLLKTFRPISIFKLLFIFHQNLNFLDVMCNVHLFPSEIVYNPTYKFQRLFHFDQIFVKNKLYIKTHISPLFFLFFFFWFRLSYKFIRVYRFL